MSNEKNFYLTEMILSIHNEVQSAVDYISDVAGKQPSELGKSSALMGIEQLRVRLPFTVIFEQNIREVDSGSAPESGTILDNLINRRGFLLNLNQESKTGLFTKVKVSPVISDIKKDVPKSEQQEKQGEIEIVFSPLKRS